MLIKKLSETMAGAWGLSCSCGSGEPHEHHGHHHDETIRLGVAIFEVRCQRARLLGVQPGPVMRHERPELGLRLGVDSHSTQCLHVQLNVGDGCR